MNITRGLSRRKRQQPTTTSIAIQRTASISIPIRHHQNFMSSRIIALPLLAIILITSSIILIPTSHAFSIPSNSLPSPRPPPFHNPSTPEEAIQNQLHYYQTSQLLQAYQCCSPQNQEDTGSLSDFERLLKLSPYDLLLNHERADVLMEVIPPDSWDGSGKVDNVACCLVCIRPGRMARRRYPVWFWWEMSKMEEEEYDATTTNENDDITNNASSSSTSDGGGGSKWMVDCIMPDFEDLDFEAESLSIDDFDGEDGDDDDGELTIYWDSDDVGGL
eukprot:CAMPEP_0201877686 /NCGR_PEP_ID=MMETSP0902-20130614/9046_1 /ASSEMBLY_ACC=CAM_ASM_000551 /TAXON_ID=420261 /ORGANISM="Thalassiosira antarctica, Strain CCMP982" /LENGTH=274 /DNA_ID=CAMNT_0048405189 /DNA_START=105 /DNA_END=929 /DNA_ORIENTATION=+